MHKPQRSSDLGESILRLVQVHGSMADKDLHAHLAASIGSQQTTSLSGASTSAMLFSAKINVAKKRLIRAGLLCVDTDNRIALTARGRGMLLQNGSAAPLAGLELELSLASAAHQNDEPLHVSEDSGSHVPADVDADDEEAAQPQEPRLRELLEHAKLVFNDDGGAGCTIPLNARARTWLVHAWESNGWVCLRAHVMRLPDGAMAKAALVAEALRANARLAVWRFSVDSSNTLIAEAEYLIDDLDGDGLARLIWMVGGEVERRYVDLLRVATTPTSLDALEAAFKRPA